MHALEFDMSGSDTAVDRIKQILEEEGAKRYRQGWDDAIKHIMASATQAVHPSAPAQLANVEDLPEKRGGRKASYGAVPEFATRALAAASSEGVGVDDVVKLAREHGEDIAASSVRRTLNSFVDKGQAHKARGRWFQARQESPPDGPETGDGDASPENHSSDWFGGRDAAA